MQARPARLLVLGAGHLRAALEARSRAAGLAGDVALHGFDKNPLKYMARAHLLLHASRAEGLPGALIQAMACGCRVISTDCPGGSREVLDGGARGPLVPPRDPAALARGIATLLADAERGPARVTHPTDRFSERGAIDQYLEVLRS